MAPPRRHQKGRRRVERGVESLGRKGCRHGRSRRPRLARHGLCRDREYRRQRGAARRRWRTPDVDGNFRRCRGVTFSEMPRWSRQRSFTRLVVPLFVFYTGRDRRFVQGNTGSVYHVSKGPPSKCPFKGPKTESVAHLRNSREARRSQLQRMAAMGGNRAFAGTRPSGEVAPIPAVRATTRLGPGGP